jgi:hypothetical protein
MWLTHSVAVESGRMPEHSIVTIESCSPANTKNRRDKIIKKKTRKQSKMNQ